MLIFKLIEYLILIKRGRGTGPMMPGNLNMVFNGANSSRYIPER